MNIFEIIELQRQGNQTAVLRALEDISVTDPKYWEKKFEYLGALLRVAKIDKATDQLRTFNELPESRVYQYFIKMKSYEIERLKGKRENIEDRDWKKDEITDLTNLEKRYLGKALIVKYSYLTKSLSEDRDQIIRLLEELTNPLFLPMEYRAIEYRDRWYKKQFVEIIKDFTNLRDEAIKKEYYYPAERYHTLIHLAHRPLAQGDPDKISDILEMMDQTMIYIEKISPNTARLISLLEHKTRYLGTLNRHEEAEEYLQTQLEKLNYPYSKFLRSVDHIIGRYHYWGKRWKKAIYHLEKCLQEDLSKTRYLEITNLLHFCHYYQGNLNQARDYIEAFKAKAGTKQSILRYANQKLGYLNGKLGNYKLASRLYETELENFMNRSLINPEINRLANLVKEYSIILVETGQVEKAKQYYNILHEHYVKEDYHHTTHLRQAHDIVRGLIHTQAVRAREKMMALEIFENLYGEIGGSEDNRRVIMTNYCDLLLLEWEKFEEDEVFELVEEVVTNIIELGKEQASLILQFKGLLLQAKLKAINEQFDEAMRIYQDLKTICGENSMLKNLVSKAEEEFLNSMSELRNSVKKTETLSTRIKKHNVLNYFQKAKRLMHEEHENAVQ